MNITSGIYAIENVLNGRRYYGSSVNMVQRKKEHWKTLRTSKHHNRYLQRVWNKHGEKNFRFVIVEYVHCEFLLDIEQKYIDKNRKGYNLSKWADAPTRGVAMSAATKAKISASKKGRSPAPNKGKHPSDETRAKISAAGRLRKYTAEQRRATSIRMTGHATSDETRAKIRAKLMGHGFSDEARKKISVGNKEKIISEDVRRRTSESMKALRAKQKAEGVLDAIGRHR